MSNADPGRTRPVFQWLAQLFALMGKESKQIIRDPSSYLVAAILQMCIRDSRTPAQNDLSYALNACGVRFPAAQWPGSGSRTP